MATAQDIIKRARRLHGSLGRGEVPSAAENVDDLYALNQMLDQWWLQRNAVYRTQEDIVSVTASSHTIGPSGDFVLARPVKIEMAFQRLTGIDYPITILNDRQYRQIADKATTSTIVTDIFYDPTSTNGTLYFYPVVSSATIHLHTRARIESFTINETVALPPGYEDALAYNLSVALAPEYQREIPPTVYAMAGTTIANIKRLNKRIPQASSEIGGRYSIFSDGYGA
jgi:hypothetical protein